MILWQEFWVEYKYNGKEEEAEPQPKRRFFKWWNNVSNPPDNSTHRHYFEVVCNEQDIEECKEEMLNSFVESKKNEGQIIVLERGLKQEKYVKDLPMEKCIELLTPAQFAEEFGYLWQEMYGGLI